MSSSFAVMAAILYKVSNVEYGLRVEVKSRYGWILPPNSPHNIPFRSELPAKIRNKQSSITEINMYST